MGKQKRAAEHRQGCASLSRGEQQSRGAASEAGPWASGAGLGAAGRGAGPGGGAAGRAGPGRAVAAPGMAARGPPRFGPVQLLLAAAGAAAAALDVCADAWVAAGYWRAGHPGWAALGLALLAAASAATQACSWLWFRSDPAALRPELPRCLLAALHLLQLGFFYRYGPGERPRFLLPPRPRRPPPTPAPGWDRAPPGTAAAASCGTGPDSAPWAPAQSRPGSSAFGPEAGPVVTPLPARLLLAPGCRPFVAWQPATVSRSVETGRFLDIFLQQIQCLRPSLFPGAKISS